MLKSIPNEVWAFDAEWVPDPATGRSVYGLPGNLPEREVLQEMWRRGGATPEEPQPYLKTVLCRVVSISVVIRKAEQGAPAQLSLFSLPRLKDGAMPEGALLERFLGGVGRAKPQLVGFNSQSADLKILMQRALIHRLHLPGFCKRPNKPWEGPDYFVRENDFHIDLKEALCGWGKATLSLHELACACGIPGKIDTRGENVIDLWMAGDIRKIVQYNDCDALSTYLVWLRLAHLSGCLSTDEFEHEEAGLGTLLIKEGQLPGQEHLVKYLEAWRKLREGKSTAI